MEFSQELKFREVVTLACDLQLILINLLECIYVHVWVQVPVEAEEFIRTPVAGVTDSCEPLGIGYAPGSSTEAASTVNH